MKSKYIFRFRLQTVSLSFILILNFNLYLSFPTDFVSVDVKISEELKLNHEAEAELWNWNETDFMIDDSIRVKGAASYENSSVKFYWYKDPIKHDLNSGEELIITNVSQILSLNMAREKKFKLFVHGFEHNHTCWFPQELKDAYLEHGYQDNLITVDWGTLANHQPINSQLPDSRFHRYVHAVRNVPRAAYEIAYFISILRDHNLVRSLSDIHLIGFSLGVHVTGHVGQSLFERYMEKVGRITGLDPAGPLFTSSLVARTLQKSDADYVDVIHTDMGENGIVFAIGHADFYVNGGWPPQPGCQGNAQCSHDSAPNYFMQSIYKNLSAVPCLAQNLYALGLCSFGSTVPFGEKSQPGTSGTFYLQMKTVPLSGRYTC